MIYFTSDLHLNHNKEFVYGVRGFNSVDEHNKYILDNWEATDDDDVYILGDLMLGDSTVAFELVKQLTGKLHIIRGNHDSNARWELYKTLPNVVEMCDAKFFKYSKYNFFLSHFPSMSGNLEKETMEQVCINLYGHTHQNTNFYNDLPYMYHVGVDSHGCKLVPIDKIIEDIKAEYESCRREL